MNGISGEEAKAEWKEKTHYTSADLKGGAAKGNRVCAHNTSVDDDTPFFKVQVQREAESCF